MIIVIIIDNNNALSFQVSASVKEIWLADVSWLTSDVHSLMRSLNLIHLEDLGVMPACKLRPSPPSASPTSRIKVHDIWIQASLSINTLVSLLSHIELDVLRFYRGSQVLHMSSYSPHPHQVSHYYQHKLLQ